MEELRFGKTDDEVQDNPAVIMARKTMKDYMKDADVVKRHGPAPKCFGCGFEFEREELKFAYIPKIGQQRKLCPDCLPNRLELDNPANRPEADMARRDAAKGEPRTSAKLNPELQSRIETAEPAKKECLNCDCKLFFLLRGGVIKCSGCGTEFKVKSA